MSALSFWAQSTTMSDNLDQGVNLETISNQSGDTLLLADDTSSSDGEVLTYDSYAATVSRGLDRHSEQTSSQDNLHVHEHFHLDNITPDRPCTAYFSADRFSDSREVFETLKQYDFLPKSIQC